MTPFHTVDYRKAVESLVERRRQLDPKLTYGKIAEAAGIQATYFSNVLKGRAHFNSDQLYSVARFLKLSPVEAEYCGWLLEWERSRVAARRAELKEKIEAIRRENLRTDKHLGAKKVEPRDDRIAEYYLDPLTKIVHVSLGIPRFATNLRALGEVLGVRPDHLDRSLRVLERAGYIEASPDGGYRCRVRNRHLPDDSPLCLPHQALMRAKSLEQMQRLPLAQRYQVSVTFSATDEVRDLVRGAFLDFLKQAERLVKGATEEKVFQMNFDLFPWALFD